MMKLKYCLVATQLMCFCNIFFSYSMTSLTDKQEKKESKNNSSVIQMLIQKGAKESGVQTKDNIDDLEYIEILDYDKDITFDIEKDYIGIIPKDIEILIREGQTKTCNTLFINGPKGIGKTSLALGLAKKTKRPIYSFKSSLCMSKFKAAEAEAIQTFFALVKKTQKPIIVLIDEVDIITKDRAIDSNSSNPALTLASEIESCEKNPLIFIILITNHKEAIDSAVLSRLSLGRTIEMKDLNSVQLLNILIKQLSIHNLTLTQSEQESLLTHIATIDARNIIGAVNIAVANKPENLTSELILELEKRKELNRANKDKVAQEIQIRQLQLESLQREQRLRESYDARLREEERLRQIALENAQRERQLRAMQEERQRQDDHLRQLSIDRAEYERARRKEQEFATNMALSQTMYRTIHGTEPTSGDLLITNLLGSLLSNTDKNETTSTNNSACIIS